jgi:intracellular multiplication protein IcmE
MQSILEGTDLHSMQSVDITSPDFMRQRRAQEEQQLQTVTQAAAEAAAAQEPTLEVLLEPGRIEYAQLVTEANTDSPGPVLAVLASGPLAGSRVIGTFSASTEYITLTFNSIVVDGKALSTSAIALDPATSKPGVITEIDQKYFTRIILPAAAAFIEGIGGAIAESGSTTVSAGEGTTTSSENDLDARQEFFKGVEEASGKVSEILDENGQAAEPMLRVAAGTHIGLLFVQPVERPMPAQAIVLRDQGKDRAANGSGVQPVPTNQIQTSGTPTSQ